MLPSTITNPIKTVENLEIQHSPQQQSKVKEISKSKSELSNHGQLSQLERTEQENKRLMIKKESNNNKS